MTVSASQMGLDSTHALVTRAREGDREALELIAGRYQSALARFAHGRLPSAVRRLVDTDDIVQVVVERSIHKLEHFVAAPGGSLLAYLRRSVLNQIRDEIRRSQRRPLATDPTDGLQDLGRDPLEQAISNESLKRYEAALAELPTDQQEAFMMRIEMNCGYRDIADALGRPSAEAARMLVRRAIAALARSLRRPPGA